MAKKHSYSYKTRRSDILTTRMIIVFALLLATVFALLKVRDWISVRSWLGPIGDYGVFFPVSRIITAVFFVLSVISGVNFVKLRKAGCDETLRAVPSAMLFAVAIAMFVVMLTISTLSYVGVGISIAFVVLLSLLYFISVCFPGSYFIMASFNVIGAFIIYALSPISPIATPILHYVLRAIVVVLAFVFVAVIFKAHSNGGLFRGIKILNPDADILPLVIAALLFALFVVLGTFGIGSYILYDIIIALETIIFALFYAIKTLK